MHNIEKINAKRQKLMLRDYILNKHIYTNKHRVLKKYIQTICILNIHYIIYNILLNISYIIHYIFCATIVAPKVHEPLSLLVRNNIVKKCEECKGYRSFIKPYAA